MSRSKTVFVEPALLDEAAVPIGIDDDGDPWGEVDSAKWEIKELPDGIMSLQQLSEPVMIVSRAPRPTQTEETDLLLMMMVDACCCPGFPGETTRRISQADIKPVPEVPVHVRHPRLVKQTRSVLRLGKAR